MLLFQGNTYKKYLLHSKFPGTTGWVDANGYLRLQDYIADSEGYRIYKSKTVYVGENRPIGVCNYLKHL